MVNREQFEEICNRYGLDSKKLIKNNENVLEKADYNSICYVLDFLRDTLKVTPNNIEKCPSILYLKIEAIKENWNFLNEKKINTRDVETCLHILSTDPEQLNKTYEYVSDENRYGKKYIEQRTSILSVPVERIQETEEKCSELTKENILSAANSRKEANDAKVLSDTEIAVKQNELSIKKAELKTIEDTKNAEADAAYEIQKEAQRKTIEVTKTEADIARQEKEVDLKKKEAEVMEQSLDADIRKKAEADKFAKQQQADAELYKRQRNAEADKFEKQQEAEAKKAQAAAELFAKQQEAEGIRAVGEAEAKAIEAKGLAEAEALEKKAEAMKKYGQAAMVEMIVKALPEMAKAIAEPLSTIDKVTIIDGNGEGSGVGSMGAYVPQVLAKTMESVKEVTGIDIADIMRANTYDAKVNKNVNITGLDGVKTVVETPAEKKVPADTKISADATAE